MCQTRMNKANTNLPIRSQIWSQPCAFLCLLVPLCSPRQILKEKRDYFAELWNLKKPWVGAPRKKRVVEGRAHGKAPAQGASKRRARTQGASPRNSKKKGRPTSCRVRATVGPGGLGFKPAARQACVQALAGGRRPQTQGIRRWKELKKGQLRVRFRRPAMKPQRGYF